MIRPEGPARRPTLAQMPDAEMPIFRGQPNVSREALQGGEPQKKKASRVEDDQMALLPCARSRCGLACPSSRAILLSLLSVTTYLSAGCCQERPRQAGASSDLLALSISAFRSLLLRWTPFGHLQHFASAIRAIANVVTFSAIDRTSEPSENSNKKSGE
ncbi:hypothetical protein HDV63DRAFT_110106 [Trichoderma sp. SZMC 28014]